MTTPTYAYGPNQLPAPIVSKTTGGNLTAEVAGTYYFCLQGQNRVGRNQLSDPSDPVTVVAGDQIEIEIPETARAECSDWRYFIVSVSNSTLPETFRQIGFYPGYEADEVTPSPLPHIFTVAEDDHLIPGTVVLESEDLPTTNRLLPGMVRGVMTTTYFYTYFPDSTVTPNSQTVLAADPVGRWVRSGPSETAISDIAEVGGCARDIRALGNAPVIYPSYNVQSGSRAVGKPVQLWRVNTTAEEIPAGTRVGIVVEYNEQQKTQLFNGLLKIRFLGYADPATGDLDKTDQFGSGLMTGVDQVVPFQARKSDLILPKSLPVGRAYAIEVYPEFAAFELDDDLAGGSDLKIYIFFYLSPGEFSEAGLALGEDWIYPVDDRRRVVPDGGLGVALLPGSYMVDSYSVRGLGRTPLSGLAPNTANQKICINGVGASWVEPDDVGEAAALRALVGTVDGRGSAGPVSGYSAIAANGQLRAVVPYPCDAAGMGTVRTDYPDRVAGNSQGRFNPSGITLYIQRQSNSETREFSGTAVVADEQQEIVISSWTSGTVISGLQAAPSNFGLFAPGAPTVTAIAGGGNFPSGNYRVWAAFDYSNRITSISHAEVDGCMVEPDSTLVEVFDRIRYHAQGAADLDVIRALPLSSVSDLQIRAVKSPARKFYMYDVSSYGVDDGTPTSRFVRLNAVPPDQPGRFVIYNELFEIGEVQTGIEGQPADVWISEDGGSKTLNFLIPEGPRGLPGPPTQFRIGSVQVAELEETARAEIRGIPPNLILDLVLPKGDRGTPGPPGGKGNKGDTGDPMDPVQFIEFEALYG